MGETGASEMFLKCDLKVVNEVFNFEKPHL